MRVTIQALDPDHLADVRRGGSSFRVTARLKLQAEGERIHYTIVAVEPFEKTYPADEFDPADYITDPEKAIFIAYLDGKPAGQVRLGRWWNRFAYVEDIQVQPEYRRQGVGRALMGQAIAWARQEGFPGLMLETQDINAAACRLYASCGMTLGGFDACLYKGIEAGTDEIALYWYLIF